MFGKLRRIERGRHDEKPQILPKALAHIESEGEPQIAIKAALVELVKNDEPRILQLGIVLQTPRENAFGDNLDAGFRRNLAVKPDGVAHRCADLFAKCFRHALGRCPRRKPPWFQHDDFFIAKPRTPQKLQGHPRGLAGPGLGHQDCGRAKRQGLA